MISPWTTNLVMSVVDIQDPMANIWRIQTTLECMRKPSHFLHQIWNEMKERILFNLYTDLTCSPLQYEDLINTCFIKKLLFQCLLIRSLTIRKMLIVAAFNFEFSLLNLEIKKTLKFSINVYNVYFEMYILKIKIRIVCLVLIFFFFSFSLFWRKNNSLLLFQGMNDKETHHCNDTSHGQQNWNIEYSFFACPCIFIHHNWC